jgi:hypothetical protein
MNARKKIDSDRLVSLWEGEVRVGRGGSLWSGRNPSKSAATLRSLC